MKKAISVCLILGLTMFFINSICRADVSRSGVLFLRIAPGARAAGMGEAFVAISDDATATHWNPAGLGVYPLTSTWLEYPLPSYYELRDKYEQFGPGWEDYWYEPHQFELKSIALLRNDIPDLNYKRYDVWAISDFELFRLYRSKWFNYEEYPTSAGESLESILRKYSQVTDEAKIKRMKEITARFNQPVSKDSLAVLKEKILSWSTEAEGEMSSLWEELLSAWDGCLLKPENLLSLVNRITNFLSDDSLTSGETERIRSLLSKVIMKRLPEKVRIPYRVLFTDTLTAIGSEGKLLWLGTRDGLFSFDGKRWKRYSVEDGLPSNHITAIFPISKRSVWVGTDRGTVKFDGSQWTKVPLGDKVEDMQVVDFASRRERHVWVATRTRLFKFDGESWQPHEKYTFKIGDTLEKVVRKFVGSENEKIILQSIERVKAYNALQDTTISAGQTIDLPFELALNGQITALTLDDRRNLWVGTDRGLKRYSENQWFTYGYQVYTAGEGDHTRKVAQNLLKSEDEEKIEKLSAMIIDYNQLDPSGKLEPGEKVYVYHNATGSRILSLVEAGGDKLFVGTEYGTVRWDGESWGRYYHAGLQRAKAKKIIYKDGELWFATLQKVVVYAHAKREITFMHANWLPELASDLYYEYFSYVQHMEGWGTVGANLTFLSLGKNVRTDEYGDVKGEFDSFEMAFAFSYGARLNPRLSTGLSAKIIYSHLADQGAGLEKGKGSGSSFALDAGLLSNLWTEPGPLWLKFTSCVALDAWLLAKSQVEERKSNKYVRYLASGVAPILCFFQKRTDLGIAATNIGPNIAYIDLSQSDPLPRNLAVGLAYQIVDTPFNRLTVTFEVNKQLVALGDSRKTEIKEAIENMGIEYWYGTYVSLRTGYIYDQVGDIKTATFGAGLQYGLFRFDFAYIPSSKDLALANTMRFSMTGTF